MSAESSSAAQRASAADERSPGEPARSAIPRLAIIVTRGTFNNLVQVATLVRAAAGTGTAVRVLFRDAALLAVRRDRIGALAFSPEFAGREAETLALLEAAEFEDLQGFLRDAKEHGDDVRYYACTSSMYYCNTDAADLIPELDAPRSLTSFLAEDVASATTVLSF
jgi:peroxiredoxin family protein